jgi:hypothetical protein
MNNWYGNILEDATVTLTFNTFDADGESATVTDLTATDVIVTRDNSSSGTPGAGTTVGIGALTALGTNEITIDTSDTTDADFYEPGHDYKVRIVEATVDGKTVNAHIGSFSIENRFVRGTDSAALATVLGAAVGASISDDIAAIPTTMVGTDNAALASVLGSAVGASISVDIAAIPTTMVGTDNAALASTLGSAVGATISADIAAIPTTMIGTDNAALASVCTEARLAELDPAKMPSDIDGIAVQTTRVDGLIEDVSGDRYKAKTLEQAPTGSGATQQQMRDAMLLAPTPGTPGDGSIDERLIDIEDDTSKTVKGILF